MSVAALEQRVCTALALEGLVTWTRAVDLLYRTGDNSALALTFAKLLLDDVNENLRVAAALNAGS